MRLAIAGIFVTGLAGIAQVAEAQGSWQPQASPSPAPPTPVFVLRPAPPPAPPPPPSGKERPPRPAGDPGRWVTNDDYPAEAVRNEQHGTTGFRLTIDTNGKIIGCDITSSSGFASLDETTCRVITRRARFSPALDKKGKPITGTWASRFRWVLQDDDLQPVPEPFVDIISFIIETDGTATGCTHSGPGPLTKVASPCGNGQVFEPPRDAAGNPVRKKVTATISFEVTDPDAVLPSPAASLSPLPKPASQQKRRKQP